MSLAYSRRTASSYSISNCKIPLVRLKVAGCATRSLAPWAAPHGGHAHRLVCICVRACLGVTAPTSPHPSSSSSSVRGISRSRNPPSCCYTLRISYHIPPHRAAAKNFPGRIICQPRFLILLGLLHTYMLRVSRSSRQTQVQPNVPSHSGQTPDVVVLARCHTDVMLPLSLNLSHHVSLYPFFLFPPAYRNNGLLGLTSVPS